MKINRFYKILIISYAISTFAEGIIAPIYAIFVQKIGGDILEATGAVATFLIMSGAATIVIHRSRWSQKHRKTLMIVGWFVWVLGIGMYLIISDLPTLFAAQVLIALGNATANPAFDAELDDHTDAKIKSYEWGLFEALQDILSGIAAITGGLVATLFGFEALVYCMIAAATISFFLILYYLHMQRVSRYPA
ncbi:MAG: MFS transporter [Candidatus Moranbacteria bacterium]|nr:MFS transporter [Candidatus Moranbacteria bacterium]